MIKDRYRPLILPNTFHDFPLKHYKYLPKFVGEPDNIAAEKHIQAFKHFIDIFEVEHDDVYLRNFSQSLQGDAKERFIHLDPELVGLWEELSDIFSEILGQEEIQVSTFFRVL